VKEKLHFSKPFYGGDIFTEVFLVRGVELDKLLEYSRQKT